MVAHGGSLFEMSSDKIPVNVGVKGCAFHSLVIKNHEEGWITLIVVNLGSKGSALGRRRHR